MTRWEYRYIAQDRPSAKQVNEVLAQFAAHGWELFTFTTYAPGGQFPQPASVHMVFKREVTAT